MRTKAEIVSDMQAVCSPKRALRLAAEFALIHAKYPLRISRFADKFADLCRDVLDSGERKENEDRTE